MYKTNFTSHKQYLFGLMQTKVYNNFLTVWKEKAHKPSWAVAAKNFFTSVYVKK